MYLVRLRNPSAEPRRCSSLPLIASVGPLDVPGLSKWASTSSARFFRVRPRAHDVDGHDMGSGEANFYVFTGPTLRYFLS